MWDGVEMGHKLLLRGEIIASTSLTPFRVWKSGREKTPIPRLVRTARYSAESTLSQSGLLGPFPPHSKVNVQRFLTTNLSI